MRILKLSWLPILILLFAMNVSSVSACSPAIGDGEGVLEARVNNAEIVVVGTVIHLIETGYLYPQYESDSARIRVERYLKGDGPSVIEIHNFNSGFDCQSYVEIGQYAVFFANGDPDAVLDASYTGVADAVWDAEDDTLTEIESITNQSSEAYPVTFQHHITRYFYYGINQTRLKFNALFLTVFGGIVTGIFVFRRFSRSRRKPKQKRG